METTNTQIENTQTESELTNPAKNTSKVTVGFKCHPELKLALSKEANQLEISLSEYVESVVLNRKEVNQTFSPELQQHLNTINQLKQKIAFYENSLLVDLYNAHKNETITYANNKDEKIEIKINAITDIYTVLINSFKTKKS